MTKVLRDKCAEPWPRKSKGNRNEIELPRARRACASAVLSGKVSGQGVTWQGKAATRQRRPGGREVLRDVGAVFMAWKVSASFLRPSNKNSSPAHGASDENCYKELFEKDT